MKQMKRAEVIAANFPFLALHPDSINYPNGAAHITDCLTYADFSKRWSNEPMTLLNEFGGDDPVWADDGLMAIEEFTKGLNAYDIEDGVEAMTYAEFITKLTQTINK